MPTKVLVTPMDGTPKQICFGAAADYAGITAANDLREGTPTAVEIQLKALVAAAARQSAKFDFGAHWAQQYKVRAVFEFDAGVVSGDTVGIHLAPSSSDTVGTGNPGGATGADAAYTGVAAGGTIAEGVAQMDFVGDFRCVPAAAQSIQIAEVGVYVPRERYGSLVVVNNATVDFFDTDGDEMMIVFDPVVDESQEA